MTKILCKSYYRNISIPTPEKHFSFGTLGRGWELVSWPLQRFLCQDPGTLAWSSVQQCGHDQEEAAWPRSLLYSEL